MTTLQVCYKPDGQKIMVQANGAAVPGGYTKLGTFDHPDADDSLSRNGDSHVWYHHIQEIMYHTKNSGAPIAGFFPESITNMQLLTIETDIVRAEGLTVAPKTANVAVAATQQLTPTFFPAGTTDKTVKYTTSDATKATVNAAGLVTGVAVGTATITVTSNDGDFKDTAVITVTA
ncbi:tail protein [Burkholderia phage vB_BpP_HN02]|uniref:Tail protein n=1 Tax=Burkholderia phage vB_BpP_HN02 TaxID=3116925 RepID=A0AAX4JHU1_9CAUD